VAQPQVELSFFDQLAQNVHVFFVFFASGSDERMATKSINLVHVVKQNATFRELATVTH